jgi:hypothetical protein
MDPEFDFNAFAQTPGGKGAIAGMVLYSVVLVVIWVILIHPCGRTMDISFVPKWARKDCGLRFIYIVGSLIVAALWGVGFAVAAAGGVLFLIGKVVVEVGKKVFGGVESCCGIPFSGEKRAAKEKAKKNKRNRAADNADMEAGCGGIEMQPQVPAQPAPQANATPAAEPVPVHDPLPEQIRRTVPPGRAVSSVADDNAPPPAYSPA